MRRLIKQIEQLLYNEECVVVPGVGAFIVHHQPAVVEESKGLIYPGRCRITFNAALSQSDGVLVRQYSEAFSFGYRRSQAIMEQDIDELKAQLLSHGVVEMGEIGKLTQMRGDDRIVFIPNESHPFSIDYYGLQPVAMLPKVAPKGEEGRSGVGRRGHIYYLPINLRAVGYGAAAAAMVAVALLIPNKRIDIPSDIKQYQAGFLATTEKSVTTAVNEMEEAPVVEVAPTEEAAEKATEEAVVEAVPELPKIADFRVTTSAEGAGRYYVVVATLSDEARTRKFLTDNAEYKVFAREGGVLVSNSGLHRVYARSFDNHEAAREYLRTIISQEAFASSWIHQQK
ncbi:MAG: hypothetical protein Q4E10_03270 [Porphyromonas sp.]|nr:hypothetical protein [Porphyromonas sp.]